MIKLHDKFKYNRMILNSSIYASRISIKGIIMDKNGVLNINSYEDKYFTNKNIVGMHILSLKICTLFNLYLIFILIPLALDKVWIIFSKY